MSSASERDPADWLVSVRDQRGPKFLCGQRGCGKTAALLRARDLLAALDRESASVFIDAESAPMRRLQACDELIDQIREIRRGRRGVNVFLREAWHLPDAETLLGYLAAHRDYRVFASVSSRRVFDERLRQYFDEHLLSRQLAPPYAPAEPGADELAEARRRWDRIMLYDIIGESGVGDAALLHRLACNLSDSTGEAITLRKVSAAISPRCRSVSPHTIEEYLRALENAFVIERCERLSDAYRGARYVRGYWYFFTDELLRRANFAVDDGREARRRMLTSTWQRLRRDYGRVCLPGFEFEGADFVTGDGASCRFWRATASGPEPVA